MAKVKVTYEKVFRCQIEIDVDDELIENKDEKGLAEEAKNHFPAFYDKSANWQCEDENIMSIVDDEYNNLISDYYGC